MPLLICVCASLFTNLLLLLLLLLKYYCPTAMREVMTSSSSAMGTQHVKKSKEK